MEKWLLNCEHVALPKLSLLALLPLSLFSSVGAQSAPPKRLLFPSTLNSCVSSPCLFPEKFLPYWSVYASYIPCGHSKSFSTLLHPLKPAAITPTSGCDIPEELQMGWMDDGNAFVESSKWLNKHHFHWSKYLQCQSLVPQTESWTFNTGCGEWIYPPCTRGFGNK